jgi:uncharacterized protein YybS (DUF2232 family)
LNKNVKSFYLFYKTKSSSIFNKVSIKINSILVLLEINFNKEFDSIFEFIKQLNIFTRIKKINLIYCNKFNFKEKKSLIIIKAGYKCFFNFIKIFTHDLFKLIKKIIFFTIGI